MNKKIIFLAFLLFTFITECSAEPRRVIIEYCTGTWCGWCPCGSQVIENQIMPAYPNTITIAYHSENNDPFGNFENNYIMSQLNFTAFPTAVIDRTNSPSNPIVPYTVWFSKVQARYNSSPQSRVNIVFLNKNYNPATRELTASLSATALENMQGTYRVQFLLTENNIIYPQFFGSGCGTYGYHMEHVHNNVARSLISSSIGEVLVNSQWNQNQTIIKSFSKFLPANWVPANMELIAFVFKDSSEVYFGALEQAVKTSVSGITSVGNNNGFPKGYSLSQNYPNPFNPTTNITFSIPSDQNVSLKFYNAMGQEVAAYVDDFLKAGVYNAEFDGTSIASGIYFYTLKTEGFTETKKMMLIK